MSAQLALFLGLLYLGLLVFLGVSTLRNRRYVLFAVGLVCPVLWFVGALARPKIQNIAY